MKFKYIGTTRQREEVQGTLEAQDEVEARMKLRAMQIRPSYIGGSGLGGINFEKLNEINIGPPVDLKGLLIFTKQFASLIDAGVPVVQCFEILSDQEKRPAFKNILKRIKGDIEAGSSLTEALKKHPKVFSNLYISLIEAGEVSGTLEVNLRRIGKQFDKTDRIRAKVKAAMIYPVITLVISVGVLAFLLVKVIPEVSKLYGESNAQLPEITVKVLGVSTWLQNYYPYIVGIIFFVLVVGQAAWKVKSVRVMLDPLVLQLPLFGDLIKKSAITRLARTLSTLVSSGVPLLSAFEICINLMSNESIKAVLAQTSSLVSEGKTMAHGLGLKKHIFPPMVVHMVSIGEVTGKLDELLEKVADIYEDEVDDAITNLTTLIQPALIIIVGMIIAFLLVAMYLPIFQLADKVAGG
ncbi:MAG: type II secretion system F family protein [Bdellovibrionota bacterium]